MSKISLEDVARSLGVSKTLVSLVINGKADAYGISKETRERVLEKVKELNYQPNQAARGLRTGKSNLIGLVVSDIGNPFYSRISRAIESFVEKNGYHLMVCSSDEDIEREKKLIRMLKERQQVDGLIISSSQKDTDFFDELNKENYPFVLIDRAIENLDASSVTVDNFKAAKRATELFIKNGIRKIACFTITPSFISSLSDRVEGYREALRLNDIKPDSKLIVEIPFNNIHKGVRNSIKELIAAPFNVKGIFALNNHLAVACLEAINDLKIRVPQDLALITFDDIELFKFSYPSVTAVSQPIQDIGTKAAEILIQQINEKDKKGIRVYNEVLPTDLVIRASCGSSIRDFQND
jgi:LacI family transcriptional regulator